jgi:hypothetical protein
MLKVRNRPPKTRLFEVGERLKNRAEPLTCADQVSSGSTRPLRIFTRDPSVSARVGGIAVVDVPFEVLQPGPTGALFEFDATGAPEVLGSTALNLDDPALLRSSGLTPSPASGAFHLQMAYAVCNRTYAVFQRALGRQIDWACGKRDPKTRRLRLIVRPFAFEEDNAFYDRAENGLCFGFFKAGAHPAGHTVPHGHIFTGLSHDVLVHETTHGLLDALRPNFFVPSHPDVLGFHEGFADIIALLQHFSYPDVVENAIRESRGSLTHADLLASIAEEFGNALTTTEHPEPLRTAVDLVEFASFDSDRPIPPSKERRGMLRYKDNMEEHDMGAVLLTAVFEAFVTIFRRKTERYYRIAGIVPDANGQASLSTDMIKLLAEEASSIAGRFLDICIRAIDYCPPLDLELGEYLRALITADTEMVANDKWGFREALMRSFRRRLIFPGHVQFMSEDALVWDGCKELRVPGLAFSDFHFNGDPGSPLDDEQLASQIEHLGAFISDPANARALNLYLPEHRTKRFADLSLPTIESIRCARRVAPDGRVLYDTIAEITQTCTVRDDRLRFQFGGGCTVVIDPCGLVRYAISKNLDSQARRERQAKAIRGPLKEYWFKEGGVQVPAARLLARVHRKRPDNGRRIRKAK